MATKFNGERQWQIFSHDAILPKLLFLLRTSSCLLTPTLQCYDDEFQKIICSITNICLDEAALTQATLPVQLGGLGIQSAVQLAPQAFLASVHSLYPTTTSPFPRSASQGHGYLCVFTEPSATLKQLYMQQC